MRELTHRLQQDIRAIGITVDFDLELKPYSKTYFGRYDPNINKITLYVYEDKKCTKEVPYKELLLTAVHEAVHCIQWSNKSFVRRKGVMHDAEFYRLLGMYTRRVEHLMCGKEKDCAEFLKTPRRKVPQIYRRHPL